MKTLDLKQEWLRKLLPDGFPYPSSTLISGPGGTGKPLVVFAFVDSWLRAGGKVIGIPLQYPDTSFVKISMKKLYNLDLDVYHNSIKYIQFDPKIEGLDIGKDGVIKANLLKPELWEEALEEAERNFKDNEIGVLVFASALNLLLFSPTYKNSILRKINDLLNERRDETFIFSVSTSAFKEDIKLWENSADNLLFTRMEKPMKLFLYIDRMREIRFLDDEINVPISQDVLDDIKIIAEHTRARIIPLVSNI